MRLTPFATLATLGVLLVTSPNWARSTQYDGPKPGRFLATPVPTGASVKKESVEEELGQRLNAKEEAKEGQGSRSFASEEGFGANQKQPSTPSLWKYDEIEEQDR